MEATQSRSKLVELITENATIKRRFNHQLIPFRTTGRKTASYLPVPPVDLLSLQPTIQVEPVPHAVWEGLPDISRVHRDVQTGVRSGPLTARYEPRPPASGGAAGEMRSYLDLASGRASQLFTVLSFAAADNPLAVGAETRAPDVIWVSLESERLVGWGIPDHQCLNDRKFDFRKQQGGSRGPCFCGA